MTGNEIVAQAFAAFELWCAANVDELEGLTIEECANRYYSEHVTKDYPALDQQP